LRTVKNTAVGVDSAGPPPYISWVRSVPRCEAPEVLRGFFGAFFVADALQHSLLGSISPGSSVAVIGIERLTAFEPFSKLERFS
jgi:hypothetical protein